MIWTLLTRILGGGLLIWFGLLGALLIVRLLRGEIVTAGLLAGRKGDSLGLGRVQMLAGMCLFAAGYVGHALRLPPGSGLPDIPPVILAMLVGSQSAYLVGKYLQS